MIWDKINRMITTDCGVCGKLVRISDIYLTLDCILCNECSNKEGRRYKVRSLLTTYDVLNADCDVLICNRSNKEKKYNQILEYAKSIYNKVGSWSDFSKAIWGQQTGYIAKTFGQNIKEIRAFTESKEYQEISEMLCDLMHKFGLVEGSVLTNWKDKGN